MLDGRVTNNCEKYNSLRNEVGLLSTNRNRSVAGEYLECSYLLAKEDINNKREFLDKIYKNVNVSQLPLSLSNKVDKNSSFNNLGWKVSYKDGSIYYEQDDINIVIFLEKVIEDGYLIFVIDEVLKGTYRAYFPANLIVKGTIFLVEPLYKSGY